LSLTAAQRLELEPLVTPRLGAYVPILPTEKQAAALCIGARELFYGGAAGGGKSDYLLAAALQYVDVSGYTALVLRRTFAQLSKGGGLLERSHQWLGPTDAKWNGLERTWTFPSGARIEFGQLQHEHTKFDYQSAQYQFVGFDELTHFSETQYKYVGFSRVRRVIGLEVPLRTRSASNPGGLGHDWVKRRCITERKQNGCVYLPAKLTDNPHLSREEYAAGLMHLDPVTREQLLNGDWTARALGGFFRREWFPLEEAAPAEGSAVRYWDLAGTDPKPGTDPDWTVGCRMRKRRGPVPFLIDDVARFRSEPAETEDRLVATARHDGAKITQWIEQEPGASGKFMANALRTRLHEDVGCPVRIDRPTGSKRERARPLASRAHAGEVALADGGTWISEFLDEFDAFGPECPHDDQVDAASGAMKASTTAWGWDRILEGASDGASAA